MKNSSNTPKQVVVQRITQVQQKDPKSTFSMWIAQDLWTQEILAQSHMNTKEELLKLVEKQGWKVTKVLNDWN